MVNTLLFSLCLVVPILIWTENPLIFRRRPFFFGLYILLDRKPTHFPAKTFFFGLHLFLVRKRVPPRNPAPGGTIFSNASGRKPNLPSCEFESDLRYWVRFAVSDYHCAISKCEKFQLKIFSNACHCFHAVYYNHMLQTLDKVMSVLPCHRAATEKKSDK